MRALITVVGLSMSIAFARPTGAQVSDHLECFKVKDQLRPAFYTADLNGLVPQVGCKIKASAAFFCVPSTKTDVSPAPPGDGEGAPANGFACYRVKCPRAALPGVVITDQFGTRGGTPRVASLLCAPLMPTGTPTSTSTTTSIPAPPLVDSGNLQSPPGITMAAGATTPTIFGVVYKAGITQGAGPGVAIIAQLGYGPDGSDPATAGWQWVAASYVGDVDLLNPGDLAADQYGATLTVSVAGAYDYAFRYSYNGGAYVYGDLDGSGNGYSAAQAGALTVQ
jgi:hypothetical protein